MKIFKNLNSQKIKKILTGSTAKARKRDTIPQRASSKASAGLPSLPKISG